MKMNRYLGWFFLLLFSTLGYGGKSVLTHAPKEASLRIQVNGQDDLGRHCLSSLQNCVISVTENTTICLSQPGSISITNNSTVVANNIRATSSDTNFNNSLVQNNGCPPALLPGASCTISFFTNTPASFTVANILVKGKNTNATYFDMNAFICSAQPQITNVTPTSGPASGGQVVTITGNFNASPAVTIGGNPAIVNAATPTQILATTPSGSSGNADIVVTSGGNASNAFPYTYVPAPVMTNITPAAGPVVGGQLVTISGLNFVTAATSVTFGGIAGLNVSVVNSTQLLVTSPAHAAGLGIPVNVTTIGGTSNSLPYDYVATAPVITAINPSSGPAAGGQVVTLAGVNFGVAPSTVVFGGLVAPVVLWSPTQIQVNSPANTPGANVPVNVVIGALVSNTVFYTYVAPQIVGINPSSGPAAGGQLVTLTGTNFGSLPSTVTFGGTPAAVSSWSPTQIIVMSPAGSVGPVLVVVDVSGTLSNSVIYTYS